MMTVKLITEQVQDVQILKEEDEKTGKKNYKLKGIFLQGDIKNRNGRVYPVEVLEKEVKRYNKEFIEQNRGYGELGHPEGPTVNLERVSHMVTSLERDGKNFIGEAKVMSTPMGKIVENIMDDGVNSQCPQGAWVVWNKRMVQTTLKTISTWQPLPILLQTHLHLRLS